MTVADGPAVPRLPLITADADLVPVLRRALHDVVAAPALAAARDRLGITAFLRSIGPTTNRSASSPGTSSAPSRPGPERSRRNRSTRRVDARRGRYTWWSSLQPAGRTMTSRCAGRSRGRPLCPTCPPDRPPGSTARPAAAVTCSPVASRAARSPSSAGPTPPPPGRSWPAWSKPRPPATSTSTSPAWTSSTRQRCRAVLSFRSTLVREQRSLRIFDPSPAVRRVLELAGLDGIFPSVDCSTATSTRQVCRDVAAGTAAATSATREVRWTSWCPRRVHRSPGPGAGPTVAVTIRVEARADIAHLALVGDFNGWSATATPMRRVGRDFVTRVELAAGRRHRYQLLVDGRRRENDWRADDYEEDASGAFVSVIDLTRPDADGSDRRPRVGRDQSGPDQSGPASPTRSNVGGRFSRNELTPSVKSARAKLSSISCDRFRARRPRGPGGAAGRPDAS